MNMEDRCLDITLHTYTDKGDCHADITLPSGARLCGFRVMKGLGEGIIVHMPAWMHTNWSCTEIQWKTVRQLICDKYKQTFVSKPIFEFHSFSYKREFLARVLILDTDTVITDIYVACTNDDISTIYTNMPLRMNKVWSVDEMTWDIISGLVLHEYRRQIFGEAIAPVDKITVHFYGEKTLTSCLVNVMLPNCRGVIRNCRLSHYTNEHPRILTPTWMKGKWVNKDFSWNMLCRMIVTEYQTHKKTPPGGYSKLPLATNNMEKNDSTILPRISNAALNGNNPVKEEKLEITISGPKEVNNLGRIQNAENKPFVFYPRTVLRRVESETKHSIISLVNALNMGTLGGLGSFEINILIWVDKLRYVTSSMLLDLVESGYVSVGWRNTITAKKLINILNRMQSYDLIDLTRFVTVDDNGEPDNSGSSIMRIITLGKTGNTLLHEIGKNTHNYNPFDVLQDGNTVKKYLTSNQWLIYWLKVYKDDLGGNYETAYKLYRKGSEFSGARLYATVTLDNITMVAEPVRRVEDFEIKKSYLELCAKLERMIGMFRNMDQLYKGENQAIIPHRPVIVLICEDDKHIDEICEAIGNILKNNADQVIWFTADLRIFNKNMAGQRFLQLENGELKKIDMFSLFGKKAEAVYEANIDVESDSLE